MDFKNYRVKSISCREFIKETPLQTRMRMIKLLNYLGISNER
jgi:hypothetical protein